MAELAVLTSPADDLAPPKVSSLGHNVVLLTWDVPHTAKITSPTLASDGEDIWPLASLRLPSTGGGIRLFWVFQRPAEGQITVTFPLNGSESGRKLPSGQEQALPRQNPNR